MVEITEESLAVPLAADATTAEIIKDIQEKIHAIHCTLGFVIHHIGLDKKPEEVVNEAGVSD